MPNARSIRAIETGGKRAFRGQKVSGSASGRDVFQPGETGYHGHERDYANKENWSEIADHLNQKDPQTKIQRWSGRAFLGISGAVPVAVAATVPGTNRRLRAQTDKMNKEAARRSVAKAFPQRQQDYVPEDINMKQAKKKFGAYNIRGPGNWTVHEVPPPMTDFPATGQWRSPHASLPLRVGRLTPGKVNALQFGGLGIAAATFNAGTHKARKENEAAAAKVRSTRSTAAAQRRKKTALAKGFKMSNVKHALSSPKAFAETAHNYPKEFGIGFGTAVGAGAVGASTSQDRKHPAATATAAVGGAGAGQLAYYGTGFAATHRSEKLKHQGQKEGHNGLSRSAQEKIWSQHRKRAGYHQGEKMTLDQQKKIFGQYPKSLPGWRTQRLAANMQHGKKGMAINAATTVGGSILAGSAARSHGRKQDVTKALYQQEKTASPIRTAETVIGLGAAAWGLGRSKMLGAALGRGVKNAMRDDNTAALRALQYAQAAQGVLRRGTEPGEQALRKIRRLNHAIEAVPESLRPEIAAVSGLLLTEHAHPIHRTNYRPVSPYSNFAVRSFL